jgi:tetratricopeptide (TPR) repeat protein/predicted Ser/Thr protein kinase
MAGTPQADDAGSSSGTGSSTGSSAGGGAVTGTSKASKVSQQSWFTDESTLLAHLRSAAQVEPSIPAIPGVRDCVRLKQGGQGVIYAGMQTGTNRRVAVKLLRVDSTAARARFIREIQLAAQLRHPAIVRVHDSGVVEDQIYLVMELIEGPGLIQWALGKPAREIAALMATVCEAIGYAHQSGVIHRDLKPDNILIDAQSMPRVVDFGLARLASGLSESSMSITEPGQFVGSLAWASPEHVAMSHLPVAAAGGTSPESESSTITVDTRSDVYALGLILYRLLKGEHAYATKGSIRDLINAISTVQPPRLAITATGEPIESDLATIVDRCLQKDPASRYSSAGDLAGDLRAYLAGEPIAASRTSAWRSLRRTARRQRALLITAGIASIALGGIAAFALVQRHRAQAARDEARSALVQAQSARQQTEQALALAESRRLQAQRTSDFLTSMLTSPDPTRAPAAAKGRDVRVADVLDVAAASIEKNLKDAPDEAAALHMTLGKTYRNLSLMPEARQQLEAAVEAAERSKDEGLRADAQFELAGLLTTALGKHEEAAPLITSVFTYRREKLGSTDPKTLSALDLLASTYQKAGDFTKAEPIFRQVAELRENALGVNHAATITSLNNLAAFLRATDKAEEAVSIFEKAHAAALATFGPDDTATFIAAANLANTLGYLSQHEKAIALLEPVVERARRVLGPDHHNTAAFVNMLAGLYQWATPPQREKAVPLFREALEITQKRLGPDARNTLLYRNHLAICLSQVGAFDEAAEQFRLAMDGTIKARGDNHHTVHEMRSQLGKALLDAGKLDDAQVQLVAAYQCLKQTRGDANDYTKRAREALIEVYTKQGKPDKAAELSQ